MSLAPFEKWISLRQACKTQVQNLWSETQNNMWKITQRKFVYLGQKQGRSTHPERNSAGVPPKEEEHGKEAVKSFIWASLVAQMVKNLPVMQETWIRSLSQEDPLEEGMASHASKAVLPGLYLPLVLYLISLFTSDLPCGFFTQCQTLCNRMDCSPPVFAVMGFSMGFSRSGLPFPSPEDLPDLRIEPCSPAL